MMDEQYLCDSCYDEFEEADMHSICEDGFSICSSCNDHSESKLRWQEAQVKNEQEVRDHFAERDRQWRESRDKRKGGA